MSRSVLPRGVSVSQAMLEDESTGVLIMLESPDGKRVSLVYPEGEANQIALAILEVSIEIREGRAQ